MPQVPEQVHLRQEQAQVQELLQQEQAALAPERAQTWSQEISLPEIAPASPVSDSPRVPLARLLGPEALPSCQKPPDWLEAPQVVNKTRPGKNQGPSPSEVSEIVRSLSTSQSNSNILSDGHTVTSV
jgi:hypothetical protein